MVKKAKLGMKGCGSGAIDIKFLLPQETKDHLNAPFCRMFLALS